jgi:hypothetical protein
MDEYLLRSQWGLIDPEMFASVADTLEDVMQVSVPGVIENVRVAEINQGSNPFRILSLRALPDGHVKKMKDDVHKQNEKNKDPQELAAVKRVEIITISSVLLPIMLHSQKEALWTKRRICTCNWYSISVSKASLEFLCQYLWNSRDWSGLSDCGFRCPQNHLS